MSLQRELELAKTAAAAAATRLRQRSAHDMAVDSSQGRDIKMAADRAAEQIIVTTLSQSPHPILAEESGDGGIDPSAPHWVVDPLDGTYNYHRDIPHYCTSIGLWRNNQPLLGVIHDLPRDRVFSGLVGEGAWLDDAAISVSEPRPTSQSVLATGFPVGRSFDDASLADFIVEVQKFKKIRLFGSAALSMAYVADGTVDAYAEDGINLWDIAAGAAIIVAAGGWIDIQAGGTTTWSRNVKTACHAEVWMDR